MREESFVELEHQSPKMRMKHVTYHHFGVQGEGQLWVHATGADSSAQTEVTLRNADLEELGRMTVPWVPAHLALTVSHVIAASEGSVLVWEIRLGAILWDATCAKSCGHALM
jgi:hypothetical protein